MHRNIEAISQISQQASTITEQGHLNFEAMEQLSVLCHTIRHQAQERNLSRTVSQTDMSEGDVELF